MPAHRLSIALCTYNGERFLGEQLASYLAQTRLPDEVVARDDASTDGTVALLRAFAAEAPFPVRVIAAEENVGYVRNFEAAIKACTGDLIALSDQDDVWLPAKLERLEEALVAAPGALLAFSDAVLVDGDLRPLGGSMWESIGLDADRQRRIREGGAQSPLLVGTAMTGATACFRAALVPLALPIDLPHWHDAWLALVAAIHGETVPVAEALVLYRQHEANELGAPKGGAMARLLRALRRDGAEEGRTATLERGLQSMAGQARRRFAGTAALSPELDGLMERSARHHGYRATLPPYPRRLLSVGRELLSGRYGAFGNGIRTAARDLLR